MTDGLVMFQYFIKVVPTRYRRVGSAELSTNQYAATMHQRKIDVTGASSGLPGALAALGLQPHFFSHSLFTPGVFFMFEISPILVQISESRFVLIDI
jgi:hypothetical protein